MKLSAEKIIIIILLITSVSLGAYNFFRGDNASKEKIEQLEKSNKLEESKRILLIKDIDKIKKDLEKSESLSILREIEIAQFEKEIEILGRKIYTLNKKLNISTKKLEESRIELEKLINNPQTKNGEELLESFREKLK